MDTIEDYKSLMQQLQEISDQFDSLSKHLQEILPRDRDRTTALIKLWEAKNCAMRAAGRGGLIYAKSIND